MTHKFGYYTSKGLSLCLISWFALKQRKQVLFGHCVSQTNGQSTNNSSLRCYSKLHQEDTGAHCAPVLVLVSPNNTGCQKANNTCNWERL